MYSRLNALPPTYASNGIDEVQIRQLPIDSLCASQCGTDQHPPPFSCGYDHTHGCGWPCDKESTNMTVLAILHRCFGIGNRREPCKEMPANDVELYKGENNI